jgi:hypothetical protein
VSERRDAVAGPSPDEEGMPDLDPPAPGKAMTGDPQEGLAPPGDRPRASVDHGVTAEEQLEGESLDDRIAREVPDVTIAPEADPGELVDDEPVLDDEAELIAERTSPDESLGRSAEEDAVHVTDE